MIYFAPYTVEHELNGILLLGLANHMFIMIVLVLIQGVLNGAGNGYWVRFELKKIIKDMTCALCSIPAALSHDYLIASTYNSVSWFLRLNLNLIERFINGCVMSRALYMN